MQEELSILQVAFSYVVVDYANGEVNLIHADWKCHGTTRLLVIATVLPQMMLEVDAFLVLGGADASGGQIRCAVSNRRDVVFVSLISHKKNLYRGVSLGDGVFSLSKSDGCDAEIKEVCSTNALMGARCTDCSTDTIERYSSTKAISTVDIRWCNSGVFGDIPILEARPVAELSVVDVHSPGSFGELLIA